MVGANDVGLGPDESDGVLLSYKYDGELRVFSVGANESLNELLRIIAERWVKLNANLIEVRYLALVQELYVTLSTDNDIRIMCRIHLFLKKHIVDAVVVVKGNIPHSALSNWSSASATDVGEDVGLVLGELKGSELWKGAITGDNQLFLNTEDFRTKLIRYCIAFQRDIVYKKNDRDKVIFVRTKIGYPWRVYAARYKAGGMFGIRKNNLEHICGADNLMSRDHPRANASFISQFFREKIRVFPDTCPKDMKKEVHKLYGVEVKYRQIWNAKKIALKEIHGCDAKAFSKLCNYCDALKETNPGSIVNYEIDPVSNAFRRVFICFAASLMGFLRDCRPIIFLDGTHIKTKFKGSILCAVATDGNNDMFTIAFATVNAENDENWDWCCFKLKQALAFEGRVGHDSCSSQIVIRTWLRLFQWHFHMHTMRIV